MLAERKKFAHLRERPGASCIYGGLLGWLGENFKVNSISKFGGLRLCPLSPVQNGSEAKTQRKPGLQAESKVLVIDKSQEEAEATSLEILHPTITGSSCSWGLRQTSPK